MDGLILALDPGTHTGWALGRRDYGYICSGTWRLPSPSDRSPYAARSGNLWSFLDTSCNGVTLYVVEGAHGFTRGARAVRVGHELRGVIQAMAHTRNAAYREIAPTTLKRLTAGHGNAGKDMMRCVAERWSGCVMDSYDEADAVCLLKVSIEGHRNGR